MKITADKYSTKLVKKFLQKTNSLTFQDTWNGFGDVKVRIVSVGETDKYNWSTKEYSRVLNIEVTAKKTGFHFRKRKSHAEFCFNKLIQKTKIPMFFEMACISGPRYRENFMGNITFKYID
jgi:hypothetical protein